MKTNNQCISSFKEWIWSCNTMTKLVLNIYCILILALSGYSQCHSELKSYTTGFDDIKANSFSFLDNELNDIKIVGYGEDTHGTAEFTLLAKELMHYLNKKHHFNILIIETGFGEGTYLNDYIQGKRDDLNEILKNHNSSWRYNTKEFFALMQSLRVHNQNSPNKIHLYGCEMQYVISDVNRIKAYLKNVNSNYRIDGFEKHLWEEISEDEKSDYYIAYSRLKKYFINNRKAFITKTSENAFNITYHHIEVIGQFITAIHQNVEQRKHDFRDIYMSENIEWILNFHGTKSKALYWAHNAHVGDWISNGTVDVAGHQLKKRYRDHYFNIATDFGTGHFKAFSKTMKMNTYNFKTIKEHSFTSCLKKYGSPNTFLNIKKAKKNIDLKNFFQNPLTLMSGAGAQIRNHNIETSFLGKAFDAVIYLDKTNEINWLTD